MNTIENAEEASRNANGGDLRCTTCGDDVSQPITIETKNGPVQRRGYDLDHFPETWAERVEAMKQLPERPSRQQVLDVFNTDVRVQCPPCNQGHEFEGVWGDYQ